MTKIKLTRDQRKRQRQIDRRIDRESEYLYAWLLGMRNAPLVGGKYIVSEKSNIILTPENRDQLIADTKKRLTELIGQAMKNHPEEFAPNGKWVLRK